MIQPQWRSICNPHIKCFKILWLESYPAHRDKHNCVHYAIRNTVARALSCTQLSKDSVQWVGLIVDIMSFRSKNVSSVNATNNVYGGEVSTLNDCK